MPVNLVEYTRPLEPGDRVRMKSCVRLKDLANIGIDAEFLFSAAECGDLRDLKQQKYTVYRVCRDGDISLRELPFSWRTNMFYRVSRR